MEDQFDEISKITIMIREKLISHPIKIPVRGFSMYPAIIPGQKVVITFRLVERINIGDIILFSINHRLILHRVIYKENVNGNMMFLSRGDPCDALDDWVINKNNILGVLTEGLNDSNNA